MSASLEEKELEGGDNTPTGVTDGGLAGVDVSASSPTPTSNATSLTGKDKVVDAEAKAFAAWVNAVLRPEERTVGGIEGLTDARALLGVLREVDPQHFQIPHIQAMTSSSSSSSISGSTSAPADSYVVRLGSLKRLYKLMMQYYSETLSLSPSSLPSPDLDLIARSSDATQFCELCKLVIGITIQSDKTKAAHVGAIQTLSEEDQAALMLAIEGLMSGLKSLEAVQREAQTDAEQQSSKSASADGGSSGEDGSSTAAFTRIQEEKLQLEKLHMGLVQEHQALRATHEETTMEKEELRKELTNLKETGEKDNSSAEAVLRSELANVKDSLRKSEDQLAEAEAAMERLTVNEKETNKKLIELQSSAEETKKLRDQMDEYRHLADKAQRTENALEKYKKKLEESAGLRRQLTELEEQNSNLVNRNAALEKEVAKLGETRPLVDSYKSQVDALEDKVAKLNEELEGARFDADQSFVQIQSLEELRSKDAEELHTFSERVQELELTNGPRRAEELTQTGDEVPVDDELEQGLDALTMTDLKLRVHSLSRQLKSIASNGDSGSKLVLAESQAEDWQRRSKKFEEKYTAELKEKLRLASEMEKLKAGTQKNVAGETSSGSPVSGGRSDMVAAQVQSLLQTKAAALASSSTEGKEAEIAALRGHLASLASAASSPSVNEAGASSTEPNPTSAVNRLIEHIIDRNLDLEARRVQLEDKLKKARSFIKEQDRLLKKANTSSSSSILSPSSSSVDADASVDIETVERLQKENAKLSSEVRAMTSAWHHLASQQTLALNLGFGALHPSSSGSVGVGGSGASASAGSARSWLGKQRASSLIGVRKG